MTLTRERKMTGIKPGPVPLPPPQIPNGLVWSGTETSVLSMFPHSILYRDVCDLNTGYTQRNGAVSKVNKKFISHLTRAQCTPSAAATVQVSHALPAVRFSCLLWGRGTSFQDCVAAGKGFLCAPF